MAPPVIILRRLSEDFHLAVPPGWECANGKCTNANPDEGKNVEPVTGVPPLFDDRDRSGLAPFHTG